MPVLFEMRFHSTFHGTLHVIVVVCDAAVHTDVLRGPDMDACFAVHAIRLDIDSVETVDYRVECSHSLENTDSAFVVSLNFRTPLANGPRSVGVVDKVHQGPQRPSWPSNDSFVC